MKANNSENYESIKVTLTKEKYPIIFENKVLELMDEGSSREEAEKLAEGCEFELELYYERGHGLWGVECEAVESISYGNDILSPYTGDVLESYD